MAGPPPGRKKAKHAANQAGLDRLSDLYQTTLSQSSNSKYVYTIKRAMESLQKCETAIVTRKQATDLKYVGPKLAQSICPNDPASAINNERKGSSSKGNTTSQTRQRRPLPTVSLPAAAASLDNNSKKSHPTSAKEQAYLAAYQHSRTLQLPQDASWKVILLLDNRERKAEHVQAKLRMSGVPCEQRVLPIGDMAWMAQSCTNDGDTIELMLGTIVERKQVDDLAGSLFGTRYLEQRLRLVHCGLPQLLLLVEGDTHSVHNCPSETLHMAMMETRVHLNFQVVQTPHLDGTVRFLKNVHRRILQRAFPSAFSSDSVGVPTFASPTARPRLKKRRKKQSLSDLTFDTPPLPPDSSSNFITYRELKAKVEWDRERGTRTVGAMHLAMLKQVPSLSHKKVQALGQAFHTPRALLEAYEFLNEKDGTSLVQDLIINTQTSRESRMGPKSSAELYHCMTQGGSTGVSRSSNSCNASAAAASAEKEEDKKMPAVDAINEDSSGQSYESAVGVGVASSRSSSLPLKTTSEYASVPVANHEFALSSQESTVDEQIARDAAFAASLAAADGDLDSPCSSSINTPITAVGTSTAGATDRNESSSDDDFESITMMMADRKKAAPAARASLNTTASSPWMEFSPDSPDSFPRRSFSPRSPLDERQLWKSSTTSKQQQMSSSLVDLSSSEEKKRKQWDLDGSSHRTTNPSTLSSLQNEDHTGMVDLSQESIQEQYSLWERCQQLKERAVPLSSASSPSPLPQHEVIEIE